jgi:hypothetical protein
MLALFDLKMSKEIWTALIRGGNCQKNNWFKASIAICSPPYRVYHYPQLNHPSLTVEFGGMSLMFMFSVTSSSYPSANTAGTKTLHNRRNLSQHLTTAIPIHKLPIILRHFDRFYILYYDNGMPGGHHENRRQEQKQPSYTSWKTFKNPIEQLRL